MDSNQIFIKWLKEGSEFRELTPEGLSDLTGGLLSATAFVRLLQGYTPWSSVDAITKAKILPKLENAFGECPIRNRFTATGKTESRPTDTEILPPITEDYLQRLGLDDILRSIEVTGDNDESAPDYEQPDSLPQPSGQLGYAMVPPDLLPDAVMENCNRCGSEIMDSDGGKCPGCKRPTDGSH